MFQMAMPILKMRIIAGDQITIHFVNNLYKSNRFKNRINKAKYALVRHFYKTDYPSRTKRAITTKQLPNEQLLEKTIV